VIYQKCSILILCLTFLFQHAYGQKRPAPVKGFKLQYFGGDIGMDAYYNYRIRDRMGTEDKTKMSNFSPFINLQTSSYIVHPSLLTLDLNADYYPSLSKSIANIHPDRVEKASHKSIDLTARLLRNKKYRIYSKFLIKDGYRNDEDVSYVKSFYKNWEIKLVCADKRIPITLSFSNLNSESENITSNYIYNFDTKRITGIIRKTINNNQSHRLQYRYTDDKRRYGDFQDFNTKYHEIDLNNILYLDKRNNYSFSSSIRKDIRYGTSESKNFTAIERLYFRLPANFKLDLNYNFRHYSNEDYRLAQNRIRTSLEQQLFRSLRSSVFFSLDRTQHSFYNEEAIPAGFSINYTKKIPTGGINIRYHQSNEKWDRQKEHGINQVVNEQHTISDSEILLLNYPFVDLASIVVKSLNQILIYRENFDYYLVNQGDYVEIKRIPGGQLDNNSIILVDYTAADQDNTSSYNLSRSQFSASISVFNRLLSVYYIYKEDAYSNVVYENNFTRDEYKQQSIGVVSSSNYHNAGIEYLSKESSILPIQQLRYFTNMNYRYNKFHFFASFTLNHYYKYGINSNHRYITSTANIEYKMKLYTNIRYSFSYRKEDGEDLFLEIVKSKLEVNSTTRAIDYSFGLEFFHRNQLLNDSQLFGVFVKFKRVF
jgi:hypothetical protein